MDESPSGPPSDTSPPGSDVDAILAGHAESTLVQAFEALRRSMQRTEALAMAFARALDATRSGR